MSSATRTDAHETPQAGRPANDRTRPSPAYVRTRFLVGRALLAISLPALAIAGPALLLGSSAAPPPAGPAPVAREGKYWTDTQTGFQTIPPTGVLQVSTIGPVEVSGGNEQVVRYSIVKRTLAGTEAEARRRLD